MTKRPNPPGGGYWYGVSTSLCDGANVEYLAGIAAYDNLPKSDPRRFRFSVFRVGADGLLMYLPLEDEASGLGGAGTVYVRGSDGTGRYACTSGKASYDGPIPGFVLHPTTLALEKKIAALQATVLAFDAELTALAHLLDGSPPTITGGTLTIPAQGPPLEGGEIRLADGVGGWITLDGRAGNLRVVLTGAQTFRVFKDGAIVEAWPKA